jgi:hypothetical protein
MEAKWQNAGDVHKCAYMDKLKHKCYDRLLGSTAKYYALINIHVSLESADLIVRNSMVKVIRGCLIPSRDDDFFGNLPLTRIRQYQEYINRKIDKVFDIDL